VYVDATLLYSPKEEYINKVLEDLKNEGMELEVENSVAGFLGVHMERSEDGGAIKLTQKGLARHTLLKHFILGIYHTSLLQQQEII
jgi:hypothetical protein